MTNVVSCMNVSRLPIECNAIELIQSVGTSLGTPHTKTAVLQDYARCIGCFVLNSMHCTREMMSIAQVT